MADPARQARIAFGAQMRELRKATGLNGALFAERLAARSPGSAWDQPKVSRIETGKQIPSEADLAAWCAETGADYREMMRMRQRASAEYATFRDRFTATGGAGQMQEAIGAAEAAATRLAQYEPALILGLLQTTEYAREMLHLEGGPAAHGASEDDIGRLIAARLRRQAILHEPGRQITLLISEAALRIRLASPPVMDAQREHIAQLCASLTTAAIGIIPFSAQVPVATLTGWSIRDDLVSIEHEGGVLEIGDPEQVAQYWHYTEILLSVALTGRDAAALCRAISAEDDHRV